MIRMLSSKRQRVFKRPKKSSVFQRDVKSVLFVCKCNLCRSPAAQSVLQDYIDRNDVPENPFVDSAGIYLDRTEHRPSSSMRRVARQRGYELDVSPRRVMRTDLDKFSLVIVMDKWLLNDLSMIHSNPSAKIKLLSDFLPQGSPESVPDPMHRSEATCENVFDMLETACPEIVEELYQNKLAACI